MRTSEVLNKAADVLQRRGWSQGKGWDPAYAPPDAPLCLEGALKAAFGSSQIKGGGCPAFDSVRDYLETTRPESINPISGRAILWAWNDRKDRTAAEVVEVLRAAAVIEEAKEQQVAPEAVSA